MEKYFTRIVAVTMLILALVSIDSGLNLIGSPVSFSRLANRISAAASGVRTGYAIQVTEDGYNPSVLHLPAGQPVSIEWVTENTQTCARSVVIPGLDYAKILPPTGRIQLDIPPQAKGTVLRYTCSMGMYPSELVFDLD
jgi:plastocyanin domain-containing protein